MLAGVPPADVLAGADDFRAARTGAPDMPAGCDERSVAAENCETVKRTVPRRHLALVHVADRERSTSSDVAPCRTLAEGRRWTKCSLQRAATGLPSLSRRSRPSLLLPERIF
jgi:hypothetical protein